MAARRIARKTGRPLIPAQLNGRAVVLEGGSIDVNGRGSLLTTEECLLDQETQALCRESDPHDANYHAMEENRERLEGFRLEDGGRIEVVSLPLPAALVFDGRRLPASYANFHIANRVVLVPTFNDPNDRGALGILAECFPGRAVVGIHAVDLVWGLGTLHCLTQQEPREEAPPPQG